MVRRLLFIFLSLLSFSAFSQDNTDTVELNKLREFPKKSVLPVRRPILLTQLAQIPDTKLSLKVNYWRNWVTMGVSLNQAAFSDNWKGGGVNSVALGGNFDWKADYTKNNFNYVSEVIFDYGKVKNKNQLQKKSADRIYWDNKFALKFSQNWNFFASINFQSQFDNGFSYRTEDGVEIPTLISKFMSPGYLTESMGFEYKPDKSFSLRFGTGTARQTFVLDTALYVNTPGQKNYGVDRGKRFRNELAFQIVANIDKDIMPNLNLKALYNMFANYETLNNIDQRLDLTLTARVNRVVNVKLTGIVLYDDDSDSKIQASQTMALGIVYKFPYIP